MDQLLWQEAEGEKRFSQSETSPPPWWGNKLRQKGIFGGLKENIVGGLWKAGQGKNCVHGPYPNPAHPSLSSVFHCRVG